MAMQSSELFLMGLFSVLDVILDKPMEEALDMVHVSKQIRDVLVERKGPLLKVYDFISRCLCQFKILSVYSVQQFYIIYLQGCHLMYGDRKPFLRQ